MPGTEPISETDVDAIRDKIAQCQDVAHSIRGKSFQLNNKDTEKAKDRKDTVEADNVGQELKDNLSYLHGLLCDAFTSLSAFV